MHNGYAYEEYYLRFFTKSIDSEIEQNYNAIVNELEQSNKQVPTT